MKKIAFIVCAGVAMVFASCTGCRGGQGQHDQDTVFVEDTVVVESVDTIFVD